MRNLFKKIVFFALIMSAITVNAQNNNFVVGQSYLGSQINHIPGCELAQPNVYYTYTGNNAAGGPNFNYCQTCPKPGEADSRINSTNTVNLTTVDREIELQKLQFQAAMLELEQLRLQNEASYQKELLKMQKKQGRWAGFTSFLEASGQVLSGTGLTMLGTAGLKGRLGTNVYNNNVYNPPSGNSGGPLIGGTIDLGNTGTGNSGGPLIGGSTVLENDPRWYGFGDDGNINQQILPQGGPVMWNTQMQRIISPRSMIRVN